MNVSVISREGNIVKFTYEATPERLEEGLAYSYSKNKNQFAIPGFRKGKVPRKMVEMQFGVGILYEDAVDRILQQDYEDVVNELKLEVVSQPSIDIETISKEEGVKFVFEVTVKPEVTLGEYKGLTFEKEEVVVTDEDVQDEIDAVREQNARVITVTDRPAQMGDIVTVDYAGTMDGVAFEGGTGQGFELTLGSHTFIDTFEDQICGHNVGDSFDVNVTFPADYRVEELAGKPAVFACVLHEITAKELPEANDEFAEDVSGFSTMDEYKASILAKLTEAKEAEIKGRRADLLLGKAADNATMDVPEVMIDTQCERMLSEYAMNMAQSGLSMDVYYQLAGTSKEQMLETFRPVAERTVRSRLVLEKIVEVEGLTATEDELKEKVNEMAERMGGNTGMGMPGEQLWGWMNDEDKANVSKDICVEKAIALIEETAKEA